MCRIPSISSPGNLIISLLQLPRTLVGNRYRIYTVCLFDSGASHSVIRGKTVKQIAQIDPKAELLVFETADRGDFITAMYVAVFEFSLDDLPGALQTNS